MVEYYIQDLKENTLIPSSKVSRNSSLVSMSKTSKIKFIRQQVVDSRYNSLIYEKVIPNQDHIMSHYHEILEKNLNSSVIFPKKPEDIFKSHKKIWLSKPKTGNEVHQKYNDDLVQSLSSIIEKDTIDSPFLCEIFTFKLLKLISKSHQLQIPVPESVIYGHGFDSATYIFNDPKGNIQFFPKQTPKTLEVISKIFSYKRQINYLIIGPVGIYRGPNSESNKVYMREKDLKADLLSLHKKDVLVQRYIIPKGAMSSKYRLVYRADAIKVFKISNSASFDRSTYVPKKRKIYHVELRDTEKGFPNLKFELVKKLTEKSFLFNKTGAVRNESRFENLSDLMDSIQKDEKENKGKDSKIEDLYSDFFKLQGKPVNENIDNSYDDVVAPKIYSELKTKFCTYSKLKYASKITEIKSQRICESLISLFNYVKEMVNSYVLRERNLKVCEFICDFFEDTSKNIYFSQIKSCRCVKIVYVPLKTMIKEKKNKKKFNCPGKYCEFTHSVQVSENNDESILAISKAPIPIKYSILRGTLEYEKFETIDNPQKLNPRLFEKVQVCENCFKAYNENVNRSFEELQQNIRKNESLGSQKPNMTKPSYMSDIQQNFNQFTRITKNLLTQQAPSPKVKKVSRNLSFFQSKRKSIQKALQFEEFL